MAEQEGVDLISSFLLKTQQHLLSVVSGSVQTQPAAVNTNTPATRSCPSNDISLTCLTRSASFPEKLHYTFINFSVIGLLVIRTPPPLASVRIPVTATIR